MTSQLPGNKENRALVKQLRKLGYDVVLSRGTNHFKVIDKNGNLLTTIANTPSDRRGILNAKAGLRRAGIPIPR